MGMVIGYARTSGVEQQAGLLAQVRDLEAAGATKVFREQISATATRRPELQAAMDFVREGDKLIVTKPCRLARSIVELVRIVDLLKSKGVRLHILSMGEIGTPTGDLILNVLMSIAQFERDLMLERQREGIAKAKHDGKYKGRAPTARAKADDVKRLHAEGVRPTEIAQRLGIGRASVYRVLGKGAA